MGLFRGIIPRLKSLRREDFPGESENFYRLLAQLSPFVSDTQAALSGALDPSNLGRLVKSFKLTTASTLEDTFAPGNVVIKNTLGHAPQSVRLGKCQPSTTPANYAQETWQAPTFTNSWVNYGSGYYGAGYRLINGKVELRGLIKSGTIGTAAFTLPVGYRPASFIVFSTDSNNAHGGGRVYSTGAVHAEVGNNAWFSLEGVSFEPAPGTWASIGPFGQPQWSLLPNGNVRIDYISGLSPLTQYDITLVLE